MALQIDFFLCKKPNEDTNIDSLLYKKSNEKRDDTFTTLTYEFKTVGTALLPS